MWQASPRKTLARATRGRTIWHRCARASSPTGAAASTPTGPHAKKLDKGFRNFSSVTELSHALATLLSDNRQPTYLSIDKDVFAPDVVRTNWDQGQMREEDSTAIIDALQGQIVGSDITGDVSSWRYATWWKRWLSASDGQDTEINAHELAASQVGQHAINERLVERIARCHMV